MIAYKTGLKGIVKKLGRGRVRGNGRGTQEVEDFVGKLLVSVRIRGRGSPRGERGRVGGAVARNATRSCGAGVRLVFDCGLHLALSNIRWEGIDVVGMR